MQRPIGVYVLIGGLLVLGLGGLYGGIAMLADPTGDSLQMAEVLPLLPVSDYVLPGIFLLLVLGLIPIFLAYAMAARPQWSWSSAFARQGTHYWALHGTVAVVVVLALWLVFQSIYIGFRWPPQYVVAVDGLMILSCALMPAVRRDFEL